MLEVYYKLVVSGMRDIGSVPIDFRDKVKRLIDERQAEQYGN